MEVVCALIEKKENGEPMVLVAQRASGDLSGKWEFPGGKIEQGENPAEALIREIREELLCSVTVLEALPSHEHDYGRGKRIRLLPFLCRADGVMSAVEHAALRYVTTETCLLIDWAAADIPIVYDWMARVSTQKNT